MVKNSSYVNHGMGSVKNMDLLVGITERLERGERMTYSGKQWLTLTYSCSVRRRTNRFR